MFGIVVNKEYALEKGIVTEETIDIHPVVDDRIIITNIAVDDFDAIVQEYGFDIHSEEELLKLINQ